MNNNNNNKNNKPPLDSKCPESALAAMAKVYSSGTKPTSFDLFDKNQSHDFYMGMMATFRIYAEFLKTVPFPILMQMMEDINISAVIIAEEKRSVIIQLK